MNSKITTIISTFEYQQQNNHDTMFTFRNKEHIKLTMCALKITV